MTMVICLGLTATMNSQNKKMMKKTQSKAHQEVLQAIESMTHAFNNRDIKGVMSSYEDGAMVIFEPETSVTDAKVLREMFLGAFAINPQFQYPNGHEVFVNGNTAMHIAPWIMTGKAPDGTVIQQNGLSVANLRKQKDGRWLLTFDNPHGGYLLNQ